MLSSKLTIFKKYLRNLKNFFKKKPKKSPPPLQKKEIQKWFFDLFQNPKPSPYSGSSTLGQILPVFRFALKTVAENRDLGRGPPNITSFESLEMLGLSTLIQEQLQLTLVFTHG